MDDRKKLISIMLACIVALIVMMIGMSCTQKSYPRKKGGNVTNDGVPSYTPEFYSNSPEKSTENPQQTTAVNEEQYIYYQTDMLGRVVGTYPVTTAQPSADGYSFIITEVQPTTAYKSMLDEYYEEKASREASKNAENQVQDETKSQNSDPVIIIH